MRWTGNGLADGTAITSGNRNTAGNGDSISQFGTSGTGGMVTAGDGVDAWASDGGGNLRRLDGQFTQSQVGVAQAFYTPRQHPTSVGESILSVRTPTESVIAAVTHMATTEGNTFRPTVAGGAQPSGVNSPAVVLNQRYRIDIIAAQSASPTTSNGRVIARIQNLDNTSWGTGGVWYYDSGYNLNVGTTQPDRVFFGKATSGGIASGTPFRLEQLGWDRITASLTSVTGQGNVEPYFMADPYASVPNVAPVATIGAGTPTTAVQNDTVPLRGTATDSDGTATLAWSWVSYPSTVTAPTITDPTSGTTASFKPVGPGDYVVRLTATDDDGATATAQRTITVAEATAGGTDNVEYLVMQGGVLT